MNKKRKENSICMGTHTDDNLMPLNLVEHTTKRELSADTCGLGVVVYYHFSSTMLSIPVFFFNVMLFVLYIALYHTSS